MKRKSIACGVVVLERFDPMTDFITKYHKEKSTSLLDGETAGEERNQLMQQLKRFRKHPACDIEIAINTMRQQSSEEVAVRTATPNLSPTTVDSSSNSNLTFNTGATTEHRNATDPSTIAGNEYLKKIQEKRAMNQKRLHDLGLTDFVHKAKADKKSSKTTNSRKKTDKQQPLRRSSRNSNKPPTYSGEELDSALHHMRSSRSARVRNTASSFSHSHNDHCKEDSDEELNLQELVKKKASNNNAKNTLTPAQRQTFQNIPTEEWLEDMEQYLSMKHSNNNVYRTMTVVKKLVKGQGVQHRDTKECFQRNVKIKLGDDFCALHAEAQAWVEYNGGDRGKGWLIEHPVRKCMLYQQARFENGSAFFK